MKSRFLQWRPTFNPMAWFRATRRMRDLLRSLGPAAPRKGEEGTSFLVVLTPWLGTEVPWFSLMMGALLAHSGADITFVLDDMPFGNTPRRFRFVLHCIRHALAVVPFDHRVVKLSEHIPAIPRHRETKGDTVERLAALNATWYLRGEMAAEGRDDYADRARAELSATRDAVETLLRERSADALLVPGGIYGSSGIWVEQAREQGMRIVSYDGGSSGTMLWASDGIACQLGDIPQAFHALKAAAQSDDDLTFIVRHAREEIAKRRAGTDTFTYQAARGPLADDRYRGAVLIALNSSWDSAALGLHGAYDDGAAWIVDSVRLVLETSDLPVIVRQHPVERLAIARTSDDYAGLLRRHFGSNPRLHFIAADDPINSYALLEQVSLVVVHTSTIGVEAAAAGKVVVTSSHSYYSDLGFVFKASDNAEQYRQCLRDAVSGAFEVTETQRTDALICYYLTQCCNWVFSAFNPSGFADWSRKSPRDLFDDVMVRTMLRSAIDNTPVAILNHRLRTAMHEIAHAK